MKLLPNKSVHITVDTADYFNFKNKGDAIRFFLEGMENDIDGNNMIVLFGGWGTGKSTLMNYIEQKLIQGKKYKTVFFTAWEHEKDNNLALSLVDAITDKLDGNSVIKEFKKESMGFFINIFRGLTIKTPEILGFGLEYDFDKQQKAIKEVYEKIESGKSFFKKLSDFKKKFQEMENALLEKGQKLIVFIDDLDRCEPENIITLLSAIKLFFSIGKRTMFFFGIDRNAVANAVKTKYGDVIKSDEYLEKIFDISFEMPKNNSIQSLLNHHSIHYAEKIEEFLKKIDFVNPRHIKKVLNKYQILKSFEDFIPSYLQELIPDNILHKNEAENELLEIMLTLFFIILYEYYPNIFLELEDYDGKTIEYARNFNETTPQNNFKQVFSSITAKESGFCFLKIEGIDLTELITQKQHTKDVQISPNNYRTFLRFLSLFTPKSIGKFNPSINGVSEMEFMKQFKGGNKNKLLYNFCDFLLQNKDLVLSTRSSYLYTNFFLMARTLL